MTKSTASAQQRKTPNTSDSPNTSKEHTMAHSLRKRNKSVDYNPKTLLHRVVPTFRIMKKTISKPHRASRRHSSSNLPAQVVTFKLPRDVLAQVQESVACKPQSSKKHSPEHQSASANESNDDADHTDDAESSSPDDPEPEDVDESDDEPNESHEKQFCRRCEVTRDLPFFYRTDPELHLVPRRSTGYHTAQICIECEMKSGLDQLLAQRPSNDVALEAGLDALRTISAIKASCLSNNIAVDHAEFNAVRWRIGSHKVCINLLPHDIYVRDEFEHATEGEEPSREDDGLESGDTTEDGGATPEVGHTQEEMEVAETLVAMSLGARR